MGRHSLPDQYGAGGSAPRPRARRRTAAVATVLVLTVAAGTAATVQSGLLSFGSSCQDDPVRLKLAASPDLAPALTTAATRARDDDLTSDGRCVVVEVTARDAYKVTNSLLAGEKPDMQVWVPDSDLWVQRLTADSGAAELSQVGNVASTPVGMAMVPTAAKSLGWPRKTYSWLELAGAAMRDDSLRLGAVDPAHSAAGLLALTRLSSGVAQSEDGDTQAAAMMKALSQRTSDTDGQVLETLPRDSSGSEQDNPKRNQALVLTEQAAFTYNSAAGHGGGLDLFYPEDGSPRLDYPYTLVDQAGPTTDQSRAAIRFMSYLRQPEQRRLLARHGFRASDDEVSDALVKRAGGSGPQPYAEPAVEPAARDTLQETLGMWTITVQSARITTVVDASSSMSEQVPRTDRSRMDITKASLLRALATFTPDDEVGLWKFSTKLDGDKDYRVLLPTRRLGDQVGDGTQRDRLSTAFGDLAPLPNGATGLYDTTLAAYRAATSSYAKGKFNALVVLTDGVNQDPGSISRGDLISQLEKLTDPKRPVPLILIAVGPDADRAEAERIARPTGGSGQEVSDPAQIQSVILKAIVASGTRGESQD